MSRFLFFAAILAAFLSAFVSTAQADDLKSMQGKWRVESAEAEGKAVVSPELTDLVVTITGETYEVSTKDGIDRGSLKVDEGQKPKAIDATHTEGPESGKMIKGIYELKGDTLRVCYAVTGGERPTEFATRQGSPVLMITYRREK